MTKMGKITHLGRLLALVMFCALTVALASCRTEEEGTNTAADIPVNAELASTNSPPLKTVETRDYTLGPEDAFVNIIMYGDFQCLRCARYARDLEILRQRYPTDVRLIWRHLPDTQSNDKAALALQAAEAAAAQGRFWDMYALLFANQAEWISLTPEAFQEQLRTYANFIGLDGERFTREIAEERYAGLVTEYQEQANELGIVGIPILLINGEPLNDRDDLFGLEGAIQLALLAKRHFAQPPAFTLEEGVDYQAEIETAEGVITLDLFEDHAPQTVNNFIFLAEQGWYDNITFFLVIPAFYAQAGDPSETGRGYPGYRIPDEHQNGLIFDRPGLVAMSHPRGETNSAGSQFFITLNALPNREAEWDGQFTIFGEVVSGFELVQALKARNAGDPLRFPNPPPGDVIIEVHILRK